MEPPPRLRSCINPADEIQWYGSKRREASRKPEEKFMGLKLTLENGDSVKIADNIEIVINKTSSRKTEIEITAPKDVSIRSSRGDRARD